MTRRQTNVRTIRRRVFMAWLICDEVEEGRTNKDMCVKVISKCKDLSEEEIKEVTHHVAKEKMHPKHNAVLVSILKDARGYWARFPSSTPYKPFRISKKQLRRAGGGNPI